MLDRLDLHEYVEGPVIVIRNGLIQQYGQDYVVESTHIVDVIEFFTPLQPYETVTYFSNNASQSYTGLLGSTIYV